MRTRAQNGMRSISSAKEWSAVSLTCRQRAVEREDPKTVKIVCKKTGGKCNYACCPRVKKNQ